MTRSVATAVAMCLFVSPVWGHTFPPVHSVVVQVERCEVALLVGYAAGSGDSTERIVARVASQPKSQARNALRETLTAFAMAPLTVRIDGKVVVPTSVRAKVGAEGGGTRPAVAVLATFALPDGARTLAIASSDPRTTRISWQDRGSGRSGGDRAPAQDRWFTGVASFLLPLGLPHGGTSCTGPGTSADRAGSPSAAGSLPQR